MVFLASVIILTIYGPVFKEEIAYSSDRVGSIRYVIEDVPYNTFVRLLKPVNTEFSIIIPKIAAVAPIVDKVNPNDPDIYLPALKEGVAHVMDSAYPGDPGNVYLFAHSSDSFYNVGKYNVVFYLMNKLSQGDEIYVYYKGSRFKYVVDTVKVVRPDEINYLSGNPDVKTLTIQTGYPAGMVSKRLILVANEIGLQ